MVPGPNGARNAVMVPCPSNRFMYSRKMAPELDRFLDSDYCPRFHLK